MSSASSLSRRPLARYWTYLVFVLPLYLFIASCWLLRPTSLTGSISLSSLLPAAFVASLLLMKVPRAEFVEMLKRLSVEFTLLAVMIFFCISSLLNSEDLFRAFRIFYPCALPLLLFIQMMAVRGVSPKALAMVPRAFLICGLLFSCLPLLLSFLSGGLHDMLFIGHRCVGFFENANQHSIMLAALIPLAIGEFVEARGRLAKAGWGLALLLVLYTLVRTGSKTAMFVSLIVCWLFYILINIRTYSPAKRVLLFGGMSLFAICVILFGIQFAEAVDPTFAKKLKMIFADGVTNYYSIESRQLLWKEAIEKGGEHWIVGAGAGEKVMGLSHAHNLVLNYFRGIGLFGAIAVALLCVAILYRCVRKGMTVVVGRSGSGDRRLWSYYVAATVYVICNQLSDSFGPTTIGCLWLIYLPAVLCERAVPRRAPARRAVSPRRVAVEPNWRVAGDNPEPQA
jgi:hypothetical protein